MKLNKPQTNKTIVVEVETSQHVQPSLLEQPESQARSTIGQRLADSMTAKIGSWAFLTVQSGVLAVWVTLNSIPGVPHWDENPFVLLNLVFSFASAYTAPVVLMSQNRQAETDRKNAEIDHKVNVKAGQNIELLHAKIDALQEQLLQEKPQTKEIPVSDMLPLLYLYNNSKSSHNVSAHKSLIPSQLIEDNTQSSSV